MDRTNHRARIHYGATGSSHLPSVQPPHSMAPAPGASCGERDAPGYAAEIKGGRMGPFNLWLFGGGVLHTGLVLGGAGDSLLNDWYCRSG